MSPRPEGLVVNGVGGWLLALYYYSLWLVLRLCSLLGIAHQQQRPSYIWSLLIQQGLHHLLLPWLHRLCPNHFHSRVCRRLSIHHHLRRQHPRSFQFFRLAVLRLVFMAELRIRRPVIATRWLTSCQPTRIRLLRWRQR